MARREQPGVEVIITWGSDYPLLATRVARGETLRLDGRDGQGAPALPGYRHRPDGDDAVLVDASGRVRVPQGALFALGGEGSPARVPDLSTAVPSQTGDTWIELRDGERLSMHHGAFRYWLRIAEPVDVPRGARWRAADLRSPAALALLGSLAMHGLMLVLGAMLPPTASALSLDLDGPQLDRARYMVRPRERIEPPTPDWLPGPQAQQPAAAAAAKDDGLAGLRQAPRTGRRGAGRPSKTSPAHLQADEVHSVGILGVLGSQGHASLGTETLFDSDLNAYDIESAIGALEGGEVGDNFGLGGLGMRGTGRGGNGTAQGTLGVGALNTGLSGAGSRYGKPGSMNGTRKVSAVPRVAGKVESVAGALSKEAIRRTIQRHLNEVRHCYEQGLRTRPELSGRVSVFFIVGPDGGVNNAALRQSDLHDARTEACITQAVRRWSFPRPEGGGIVAVTYPFMLQTP